MRLEPFKARKFNKNTFVIEGKGSASYLLLGERKALLIDTGMRPDNLGTFIRTLTDLPVVVVNTHGHCDHITGNIYSDDVYMSQGAVADAEKFYETMKEQGLKGNYQIKVTSEGDIFDLGGRTIEVIEIPCHSPGDLDFLDRENRLLFTGDNLEVGQVLIFYGNVEEGATVEGHLEIMNKLKQRENEFDLICPAHNGFPIDKCYLQYMIENDCKILDGIEGTAEIHSPTFPPNNVFDIDYNYIRCSFHKGTSLVYDKRRIRKADSKGLYHL